MNFLLTQTIVTGVSLLLLTGVSLVPAQAQTYSLTDLGTLGGNNSSATGVNDFGQVTGEASTGLGLIHAFLSGTGGGALKDLGTLGGDGSIGRAVNDKGQVTGDSDVNGYTKAFLSEDNGGTLKNLGSLGGSYSSGGAVNGLGQVAGDATTAQNTADHVFLSGTGGSPLTDAGTLPGAFHINATGLNDAGQITGYSNNGQTEAYISAPGGGDLRGLGTLSGGSKSYAVGINGEGQVVGFSNFGVNGNPSSGFHAFLSEPNGGTLTDLGTLGTGSSYGGGVNDSGQVVGSYAFGSYGTHAFLFANGQMADLNDLIAPDANFTLDSASGISDTGFIVGTGTTMDGYTHAFLLAPLAAVPEASATVSFGLLLALGMGGAVVAAGKKKTAAVA